MIGPVPILPDRLLNQYPPSAPEETPSTFGGSTENMLHYTGPIGGTANFSAAIDRLRNADSPAAVGAAAGELTAALPTAVESAVFDAAQGAVDGLKSAAEALPGPGALAAPLLEGVSQALSALETVATATTEALTYVPAQVAEATATAGATVAETVSNAVTVVVDTVESAVASAAAAVSDWLRSWF